VLRLVGLWTEPVDIDAFEREYLGSHVPRLERLTAAQGSRTARCIDGPYFRMTEVFFHALDDIQAALESPGGQEVIAAARALANKYGIRLDVLVVTEPT
jgi:hypothetical protein